MARRGTVNTLAVDLTKYNYILNGVGGIGKTTLAYELGLKVSGNTEGTFIVSIGEEPVPLHIDGALYDKAPDWSELTEIIDDLVDNKVEYPHTKFVAMDSLDELFRIAEEEVVRLHNKKKPDNKVDVIKQAFGGYQAGEDKVIDMVINLMGKIKNGGYSVFFIGHTKQKNKKDIIQDVEFAQYTNKLPEKYYGAIKDKVSIACVAYNETQIADIKEVKDVFTKGKKKVGNLIGSNRVLIFRDDDNAVDTKSHFKHIVNKVEFSTDNFIEAVQNAIKAELEEVRGKSVTMEELDELVEQQREETTTTKSEPAPVVEEPTPTPVAEEVPFEVTNSDRVAQIQAAVNGKTMDMAGMMAIMKANKLKNFSNPDDIEPSILEEIIALIK